MVPARLLIGKRIGDKQAGGPGDPGSSGPLGMGPEPGADPSGSSDSSRASWKTLSNRRTRHLSYRMRMAITFALVAGMTALVLVAVLAVVWEAQFMRYTRTNMERYASVIAQGLAESYEPDKGWTQEELDRSVQTGSVSSDIGVQILDAKGQVIYDDTWATHGSGESSERAGAGAAVQSSAGSSSSDSSRAADASAQSSLVSLAPTDADAVVSHAITSDDGADVGTVRLWAFGSEALITKGDAAFRTNSYNAVALASVVAVILACLIGVLFSRRLAKPIKSITSTAAQIRSGDLTARTGIAGDDEIGQLGETFDDMATSLERDLKLEHRLTSDVAHELRTPLMAMLATVEAMQDGVLPTDEEHLETVAGEVRRLSRLVSAMLTLSRIENGTTPFEPVRTDMVGLVRSIVSSQEQLFHERDLRLRFDVKGPRKEIFAEVDRDMISQAVINLLSNALRYTPEGGWVVVTMSQEGREALVTVSDTGIGIAKEDLARVFSRFWRSDASRERESGGLGVGMAVTKEIIDRHHGYIGVESELNKGTKFTLHIPRTQEKND